jgi:hypothetical protein
MKLTAIRDGRRGVFHIHRGDNYRGMSQLSTNHVEAKQRSKLEQR